MSKNTEIERKWLFSTNELCDIEKITPKMIYECVYLSESFPEIRISRKHEEHSNDVKYKLTIKGENENSNVLCRKEIEKELTKEDFFDILAASGLTENDMLRKEYYLYRIKDDSGTERELGVGKVYPNVNHQLGVFYIGEIEFNSLEDANTFIAPKSFGKEVTTDDRYKIRNVFYASRI